LGTLVEKKPGLPQCLQREEKEKHGKRVNQDSQREGERREDGKKRAKVIKGGGRGKKRKIGHTAGDEASKNQAGEIGKRTRREPKGRLACINTKKDSNSNEERRRRRQEKGKALLNSSEIVKETNAPGGRQVLQCSSLEISENPLVHR